MLQHTSHHRCHLMWTTLIAMTLVLPSFAMACLWDYDTLMQERSRFPSVLELITGKFPRHTQEFYEWRVKDRQKKIAATGATPELLDDLAVAFDKIGDHDQAIATMELAEQEFPGRYETAANQGTFYFHAKRLEEGIPHIERALQIKPDAHFGREKYQLLLVKYLLSKQVDGKTKLPLTEFNSDGDQAIGSRFRDFVRQDLSDDAERAEIEKAIQGILGMMRFGKHDSPILLEALGDLLYYGEGDRSNNQQLASRAYLQASYLTKDQPEVSSAYRRRAEVMLSLQMGGSGPNGTLTLAELESTFQKELSDANAWTLTVVNDEHHWLASSPDPDAAYAAKYASDPEVPDLSPLVSPRGRVRGVNLLLAIPVAAGLLLAAFILLRFWLNRNRRNVSDSPDA